MWAGRNHVGILRIEENGVSGILMDEPSMRTRQGTRVDAPLALVHQPHSAIRNGRVVDGEACVHALDMVSREIALQSGIKLRVWRMLMDGGQLKTCLYTSHLASNPTSSFDVERGDDVDSMGRPIEHMHDGLSEPWSKSEIEFLASRALEGLHQKVSPSETLIYSTVTSFSNARSEELINPVNLRTGHIKCHALGMSMPSENLEAWMDAARRTRLKLSWLAADPWAASKFACQVNEQKLGVRHVTIGPTSSHIVYIADQVIKGYGVRPFGFQHLCETVGDYLGLERRWLNYREAAKLIHQYLGKRSDAKGQAGLSEDMIRADQLSTIPLKFLNDAQEASMPASQLKINVIEALGRELGLLMQSLQPANLNHVHTSPVVLAGALNNWNRPLEVVYMAYPQARQERWRLGSRDSTHTDAWGLVDEGLLGGALLDDSQWAANGINASYRPVAGTRSRISAWIERNF